MRSPRLAPAKRERPHYHARHRRRSAVCFDDPRATDAACAAHHGHGPAAVEVRGAGNDGWDTAGVIPRNLWRGLVRRHGLTGGLRGAPALPGVPQEQTAIRTLGHGDPFDAIAATLR